MNRLWRTSGCYRCIWAQPSMRTLTKWVTHAFCRKSYCFHSTAAPVWFHLVFFKCQCLFYDNEQATKKSFLKYFLENNKVARKKKGKLKREIQKSNKKKSKRSTGESPFDICCSAGVFFSWINEFFKNLFLTVSANECTVGNITQVTITAETFPVDYDVNQFNCCLSASTVKNSLASITGKVDEESYLSIVLSKLREVSDAGLMTILRTDVSKSAVQGVDT